MATYMGFVKEVAWMPLLRDTSIDDYFEEGESVSLASIRDMVADFEHEIAEGKLPEGGDDAIAAVREFLQASEDLWEEMGWDPSSAAMATFS